MASTKSQAAATVDDLGDGDQAAAVDLLGGISGEARGMKLSLMRIMSELAPEPLSFFVQEMHILARCARGKRSESQVPLQASAALSFIAECLSAALCPGVKCVILDFLVHVWLVTDAAIDPVRAAVPQLSACFGGLLRETPAMFAPPGGGGVSSDSRGYGGGARVQAQVRRRGASGVGRAGSDSARGDGTPTATAAAVDAWRTSHRIQLVFLFDKVCL